MDCTECQSLLSDHIDDDLSDRMRREVEMHLASCQSCATVRTDLVRIIEASGALPAQTPSSEVWTRIEREISESNVLSGPGSWWDRLGSRRFDLSISGRHMVAAAAAVVVIFGTLATIRVASPGSLPSVGLSWNEFSNGEAVTSLPLANDPSNQDVMRLRGTIDSMARSAAKRQERLAPEVRQVFEKQIAELDQRIAERDRAFAFDGTAASRERLMAALADKLNYLDEFEKAHPSPPLPY